MNRPLPLILAVFLLLTLPGRAADVLPFEIKQGDRVLLMGDTLIERENTYGHLETRLHEQFPTTQFIVRNLGFSADTPLGFSRASFDPAVKGIERIREQLALVRPTVAILGYGMAASLEELTYKNGDPTLNPDPARYGTEHTAAKFKGDLARLMDLIVAASPEKSVRFILLSPIRHEDLREKRFALPNPAVHNALLDHYSSAIKELAEERGARFISFENAERASNLTVNGIHPTDAGYRILARELSRGLGWAASTSAPASRTPHLREAILRKNTLFFYRWRPSNETYLLGFRKNEQGQNAAEIPKFDPLIEKADVEIHSLASGDSTLGVSSVPAADAATASTPAPASASSPLPPRTSSQPPLPPQNVEFTVAEGLEISLFAQNPLLEKPVQMNWDGRGRLWVASSSVYPQIEPGAEARDKIVVLEDTDHDGRADKSTVFADGLLIPTGVVPDAVYPPGENQSDSAACYVGASTELLHFGKPGPDGKATERTVVLSGFGTEDTHHLIHTLHWSLDGKLYFHQSIYIHSHVETPWGVVRANSGAVFAYDPRTERLEIFARGMWNSWGQQEDRFGQTFLTDGAGYAGISWAFPGAVFTATEGARRSLATISPGSYPKFSGLELIQSPHFPDDWQGNAITCDFRAHRIVRFGIDDLSLGKENTPPASGYVTRELPDLVRTSDMAFRPIDVRHGPDGALYVADWSNPVINHGEVDFRDPRRDKHQGRIWRIAMKNRPVVKWEDLEKKSGAELFKKLGSANRWEKEQAARQLATRENAREIPTASLPPGEKPPAAHKDYLAPIEEYPGDEMVLALRGVMQSRWLRTPGTSGSSLGDLIMTLSASKEPRFRAMVARELAAAVPPPYEPSLATITMLSTGRPPNPPFRASAAHALSTAFLPAGKSRNGGGTKPSWAKFPWIRATSHPRVRLENIRALARTQDPENAMKVLYRIPTDKSDDFLDFAIWQAINDLAKPWADSVLNGQWRIKGNERQLEYALNALSPAAAAPVLAFVLREKPLARDGNGPWIELIGKAGGPVELRKLLDVVLGDQLDPKPRERALAALIAAARERNVRPEGHLGRVTDFLQNENSQLRGAGARLAGLWKIEGTAPRLTELSDGDDRSVRAAALEGLRDMTGPAALDGLLHLADEGKSPAVRRAALVALAPVNLDAALARFPKVLADPASDTEMLELWRGILRVDGAAAALEKAFPPKLSPAALAAGLKAARETGYKGALLAKVIEPLAGRITLSPKEMANAISGMVFQVKVGSDPSLGELVYRRIGCAQCHAIGGAGGKLGPDFTSLGASAPVDYIIESVLDPAAKVKEGYHAFAFVMKDGSQLTGIPARETGAEQFIRPGPGAEVPLVKTNIVSRENVGSIMPAGLVDMLDFTEKRALFAFLGELGKPGVFDASKGNVARVWWLYADAAQAFQAANPEQNLPVHSLVDGRLVRELLAPLAATVSQGDLYAASRFEMAAGEEKPFVLLGAKSAWIDGEAVAIDAKGQLTGRIPAGPHVLAIRLDARQLPEAIKAQCDAARFLGE